MARIDLKKSSNSGNTKSWTNGLSDLMSRDFQLGQNTLSNGFKEQFYSDLHVLIESGLDIRSSLDLIVTEVQKGKNKEILERVRSGVFAGRALSSILQDTEGFSEYEIHSIRIGEETGAINTILANLSADFRDRIKMRRELVTALSYPVMVMIVAMFAVGFMMTFVVPLFSDLFKRMGQQLPWLTRQVIGMSDFISAYWWVILLMAVTLILTYVGLRNRPEFRSKLEYVFLQIPLFGSVLKESVMARFTGSMAFMLKSQVTLLRSLKLSAEMTDFIPLKEAMSDIERGLLRGESFSKLVQQNPIFDSRFGAMIKVGEEVNQLERVFGHLSTQYSEQIQRRTKNLSTFLEPLMIGFLGVVVGLILIAMYLPLFEMNSGF